MQMSIMQHQQHKRRTTKRDPRSSHLVSPPRLIEYNLCHTSGRDLLRTKTFSTDDFSSRHTGTATLTLKINSNLDLF